MKFLVERASDLGKNKPCDESYRVGDSEWGIDIDSLEDLIKFKRKYGKENGGIILDSEMDMDCYPGYECCIIIYDDYVE